MSNISIKFQKSKKGDLFMDTVARSNPYPRVLVFDRVDEKYVYFTVHGTDEKVTVSSDDLYGRYPKLDDKRIRDMREHRDDIIEQLAMYNHILSKIDGIDNENR